MVYGMVVSVKRRRKQERRLLHRRGAGISILNRLSRKDWKPGRGMNGFLGGGTFQRRERPMNQTVPTHSRTPGIAQNQQQSWDGGVGHGARAILNEEEQDEAG